MERRGYPLGRAGRKWGAVLLCLVPAGAYYAFLLSLGFPGFFALSPRGLTFNSMLLHLLHGSFDVDPQTIGDEGVLRNGLTYAYFGVAPALLRSPLLVFPDFASTDYSRLSCLAAVCVMAASKLASLLTVWQAVGRRDRSILLVLLAMAVLLGGAQIQFLRGMLYQEVVLWAAALASTFVYLVVHGCYTERGFGGGTLIALAAIAGLCLLTRVSTALGLYAACFLLSLTLTWRMWRAAAPGSFPMALLARFLPAALTLCGFAAITGFINYERFGNPFAFTDPQNYLWAMMHGRDRLIRDQEYGIFNIVRLGYGLVYYFFPVWVMRGADGALLWSAFQHRTIDSIELPPSSFFISDPLLIGLTIFTLFRLVRSRDAVDRAIAVPVLVGLCVPIGLILTFVSMSFRYRLEFYPFFELCAFLGFGLLLSRSKPPPRRLFATAAVAGVVSAHAFWLLYMLSPLGDAGSLLGGSDVVSFYRSQFHR
jgi:hypothetical protein